jgi:2,5-furandicarboxylate decarboxylase 1
VTNTPQAGRPARNLGDFLAAFAEADPTSTLRIKEPVALDYELTAIAMELGRRGQSPVLWFERVGNSPFPVVANMFANRQRFAFAAGVPESELLDAWGRLGDKLCKPELVDGGPILDNVLTGADVDMNRLPIPRPTAKLIIDATRKPKPFPKRHTLLPADAVAKAHAMLAALKPR